MGCVQNIKRKVEKINQKLKGKKSRLPASD